MLKNLSKSSRRRIRNRSSKSNPAGKIRTSGRSGHSQGEAHHDGSSQSAGAPEKIFHAPLPFQTK